MRLAGAEAPHPCADRTGLFFAPAFEPAVERATREAVAKTICAACPDRTTCLRTAIVNREPDGIWGGFTTDERAELARRALASR